MGDVEAANAAIDAIRALLDRGAFGRPLWRWRRR